MFSEELLKKAESGNAEAALEVANCYYRGIDVEENNDKAFAWFNRILEMDPNNAVALTNPGSCYRGGFGVEQDHCKAVEYYERAIKYDNKGALWYLRSICMMVWVPNRTLQEQLNSILKRASKLCLRRLYSSTRKLSRGKSKNWSEGA